MPHTHKDKILLALLRHVALDGWADEAMRNTAEGKNIRLEDLMLAFPAGIPDALAAFANWGERQMLAKLAKHKLIQMRVRDRVALGVRLWIEVMQPHRECVRAAIQSAWRPGRALGSIKNLAHICDVIWHEAGDNATDFNYYTKRGLLAAVFGSTLLYWLQDSSESFEKTFEFLDARIENAMQVGKMTANIKNVGKLFEQAKGLSGLVDILPLKKSRAA